VDNVALGLPGVLIVAKATQAQSVGNVTLTQHHVLVVANATQAQSAANVVWISAQVLVVANAAQAQSAGNVTLISYREYVLMALYITMSHRGTRNFRREEDEIVYITRTQTANMEL